MSVEGGSIGGGVAAPVVVNEGPFRGSLEGFKPMNASDINTIDFKGGTVAPSQPLVIQQAEAVAAAAWEAPQINIAEAQEPALKQQEAVIVPNVIPAWMPDQLVQLQPQVVPIISPITSTIVEDNVFLAKPQTEQRVRYQVAPAILPQPFQQEQIMEEEVLEKVQVEEPKDSLEGKEEIKEKNIYLEDEKASAVRKFEIKQAIKLVKLPTIVGSLVAAFLPGEHAGNRSSALKEKGPDGSYEETVEAIASSGEFSSPEQAEKKFEDIVAEKKPIKNSKEGSPVAESDVARVFKHRAVKPPAAVEIYTKRVVKKQAQVPAGQAVVPKTETSLVDYPELEEVFQKAA